MRGDRKPARRARGEKAMIVLTAEQTAQIAEAMLALRVEVQRSSVRRVATRLGVCPATVSLAMNDEYPASRLKLAGRVMRMLAEHHCPHTGAMIAPEMCRSIASSKAPTHHPAKMAMWIACRECEHNEEKKAC